MHVVPDDGTPEEQRVGGHLAAAPLLDPQSLHIEGVRALLLDQVVVYDGVLARHELRHGVREVDAVRERYVVLDHDRLGVLLREDQVPRMRDRRLPRRNRHVQQVDRPLQNRAPREVQERAVVEERRVERGEGALVGVGVPGQMRLHEVALGSHRFRQRADPHPLRQATGCRQGFGEAAVHPDRQVTVRGPDRKTRHVLGRRLPRFPRLPARGREPERRGRDRRDVGEAPILVHRGREAELREARDRLLADRLEPRAVPSELAREPLEALEVDLHGLGHSRRHIPSRLYGRAAAAEAPAAPSTPAYPFSSSSRASSLPPDFTIRPSMSTCTTSGTM